MSYKSCLSKLLCLCVLGSLDHLAAEEANHPSSNTSELMTDSVQSKRRCHHDHGRRSRTPWFITGNNNIDPTTNFLGTFDQVPINISANGVPLDLPYIRVTALGQIEVLNTNQGVFVGEGAGASNQSSNNTFVGYQSGFNTTIEPIFQQPGDNTALGNNSLFF